MQSPPILTVDRLTVQRGSRTAVQDVSFSLPAGKDMAIVGPNGAGKSTLIQAILGLLPHHSGEVRLLGNRSSNNLRTFAHHEVAYLPQNFVADSRIPMTVVELVGLGWDKLGFQLPWSGGRDRRNAIRDALAQVEVGHLRSQSISSLSGGELKRVLLAYCLVRPRRLLVLDEAPAGLDVYREADVYALLSHLKREQGWSILQISHDLEMVREHCDCVLCLNRQLLKQGAPDEVLSPDILNAAYGAGFA